MTDTARVHIGPIEITTLSPLRVATGYSQGLLDRTVVRRRRRLKAKDGIEHGVDDVYLPASSFKGRLRHTCEQLAVAASLHVCGVPDPQRMCPSDLERQGRLCLSCRVFGAPGRRAGLLFHDAVLADELAQAMTVEVDGLDNRVSHVVPFGQTRERTQVQLNRRLGTAEPDHLFMSETATEGLTLTTRITGYLPITPIPDGVGSFELLLLLAGLAWLDAFGGGRSTGGGRSRIALPPAVELGDASLELAAVLRQAQRLTEYPDAAGEG